MDGGAWRATAHGVAKSRTQLSNFTFFSFLFLLGEWLDKIKNNYCLFKTDNCLKTVISVIDRQLSHKNQIVSLI